MGGIRQRRASRTAGSIINATDNERLDHNYAEVAIKSSALHFTSANKHERVDIHDQYIFSNRRSLTPVQLCRHWDFLNIINIRFAGQTCQALLHDSWP